MRTGMLTTVKERPPRAWARDEITLTRRTGDVEAFRDFYRANAKRLVVFFTRRTLDAEVAMDLTAETFATALQRRTQFRGATAAEAEGWLFAIARSQLSHYWRRGVAERRALRDAIAGIHPQQAYAVTQRVVLERDYEDLARELGVSQDVVRARVSRGLRALAATNDLAAAA
jgi:DNA-directed RNA polymerase specialized sigma24 family protein